MKSIEEQIEALTQELRPYPGHDDFYTYDPEFNTIISFKKAGSDDSPGDARANWYRALFASTNKADVEEYADCYRRLKLYQLLGKKAEKEFPLDWRDLTQCKYATDFVGCAQEHLETGLITCFRERITVLGGVWFSREQDRIEALRICGIDRSFQEKCSNYNLGGA